MTSEDLAPLAYGLIGVLSAVLAAWAGIFASYLDREVGPIEVPGSALIASVPAYDYRERIWKAARGIISKAFRAAQIAAAGFTIAAALFVFAATQPPQAALSIFFVVIGATMIVVAGVALVISSRARRLPRARKALDEWYYPWVREYISAGESPTKEETAQGFGDADPTNAAILKRFKSDPFD